MTVDARSWTMPPERSGYLTLESSFFYGIAVWLALIQVSIAASHVVLGTLVLAWIYLVAKDEAPRIRLPFDVPFALYAGLSLLAAIYSFDPGESLGASKELLLLVVPYLLVSMVRRQEALASLVLVLVAMADVGALVGLWQHHFQELPRINHRIHGFLSHYMTYSGLLMGVSLLALAGFLFSGARASHRWFHLSSFFLIQLALVLTLTRSAWVGVAVTSIVLLAIKDRRLLVAVPVAAVALALLVPRDVQGRLFSFIRPDTSGMDRLYMLRAGALMVRNHPFLGVGPEMVSEVYPIYVSSDAPRRDNPHLHNNLAQVAAERGLAGLAVWLWIVALSFKASLRALWRNRRDGPARAVAAGAFAVLLSGFLAGLFEYNFGDSEFQMLFLFAMSVPLVLEREGSTGAREAVEGRDA
jgi:O-antigen ligase